MTYWQIIQTATAKLPDPNDPTHDVPYITVNVEPRNGDPYKVVFRKVIFANKQRTWAYEKLERIWPEGGIVTRPNDGEFIMPPRRNP